jgi:hypothetical protein
LRGHVVDGDRTTLAQPTQAAECSEQPKKEEHESGSPGGAFARAGMRTAMRVMDHIPPVKRRIVTSESTFRGSGRDDED